MPMKVKDLMANPGSDGWMLVRTRGSRRQYHHGEKPGTVTVAGKPSVDIPPGTSANVLQRADIRK